MIHGTKMILVPQELAKVLNGDLPQPPAPAGSYSAMDAEMSNILKSKNVDDFTKWKQYDNVLQRYMAKVERTKNSLAVNFESDDDDDAGAQQPQLPLKNTKKVKAPAPKKTQKADRQADQTKPKRVKPAQPSTLPPEILNKFTNFKDKKHAKAIFSALGSSSQVMVTKAGVLKIKRKNIGLLESLITYKVRGETGDTPTGWAEFSGFIEGLKEPALTKPVSLTRPRRATSKLVGNGRAWLSF
jgi:hypothetical protein